MKRLMLLLMVAVIMVASMGLSAARAVAQAPQELSCDVSTDIIAVDRGRTVIGFLV